MCCSGIRRGERLYNSVSVCNALCIGANADPAAVIVANRSGIGAGGARGGEGDAGGC
jgi:hypothetical protein